eukprot:scaffold1981_cov209-Prasinococcus_capsulatus_cf.AAC.1
MLRGQPLPRATAHRRRLHAPGRSRPMALASSSSCCCCCRRHACAVGRCSGARRFAASAAERPPPGHDSDRSVAARGACLPALARRPEPNSLSTASVPTLNAAAVDDAASRFRSPLPSPGRHPWACR